MKEHLKFNVIEAPVQCSDSYLKYDIIAASCCCDGCSGNLMNGSSC